MLTKEQKQLLILHFKNFFLTWEQFYTIALLFWHKALIQWTLCLKSVWCIWCLSLWHVLGSWPLHCMTSSRQLIRGYGFFSVELAPAYGAHVTRTLVTRKVIVPSKPYGKANYHSPALLHMLLPNSMSTSYHGSTAAFSLKASLTE